jgi:hypothetical protein
MLLVQARCQHPRFAPVHHGREIQGAARSPSLFRLEQEGQFTFVAALRDKKMTTPTMVESAMSSIGVARDPKESQRS